MPLFLALSVTTPGFAQMRGAPPRPPVIRDPIPGPFFVYFRDDSVELDRPALDFLRTIASSWNDNDGALVVCFDDGEASNTVRWRQLKKLKMELGALGVRKLFRALGKCPASGREPPEGFAVFAIYGIAAL